MVKRSASKEPDASRSQWEPKQKIKGACRLTSGNCLLTSSQSRLYKVQFCHVHVLGNTKKCGMRLMLSLSVKTACYKNQFRPLTLMDFPF